mmetsp:Transcript_41397/g.108826  ORF Transcript_41397/g.108826 Transcript_41397/m.108826 type:complete len:272 (+) Transcript_41397:2035-2850(+)
MGARGGAHGQHHFDALDRCRHVSDAMGSAHSEPPRQQVELQPHNAGHHLWPPFCGERIDTFQDARGHLHSVRHPPPPARRPQQMFRRFGEPAERGLREIRRVRGHPRGAGYRLLLQGKEHLVHEDGLGRVVHLEERPQRLASRAPHRRILVEEVAADQRGQLPPPPLELEPGDPLAQPVVQYDSCLPVVPNSRQLPVPRLRVYVLGTSHSSGATCELGLQQHRHFWPPPSLDQISADTESLLKKLRSADSFRGLDGVHRWNQDRAELQQES